MRRRIPIHSLTLVLAGTLLLGAGSSQAEDVLGRVSSVGGDATAQRPGGSPRVLACGDPVFADDTLRTGDGSRVGVLLGDVMTHLSADTRVRLDRTGASMPKATLERGKVRMIDPRETGAPAQLAALDATGSLVGNDAEAYVFTEKVGPYAMLCEWDSELPVERGDERVVAGPRNCVISKPDEPLYTARAHDARIPATAAEACDIDPATLASLAGSPVRHLTPADVAAPGPVPGVTTAGLGSTSPIGSTMPVRSSCDTAGCQSPMPVSAAEPAPAFVPPF